MGQKVKDDPQIVGTCRKFPGKGTEGGCCGICFLSSAPRLLTKGDSLSEKSWWWPVWKQRGGDEWAWKAADEQVAFPNWQSHRSSQRAFILLAPPEPFLRFISLCLCAFFLSSSFEQTEQNKHDLWENVQSPAPLLQTKHYQEGARTKAFVQVALPFSPFLLLGGFCFL